MQEARRKRNTVSFLILILLLLLLLGMNVAIGSTAIPMGNMVPILLRTGENQTAESIVWNIRMPRLLAAAVLGGALSVAGFQLQTFFANPIAGPFVLGISSGAKLSVALLMIACLQKEFPISSGIMILAAFIGAMVCMGVILLAAGRVRNMAVLIVCGVMIGYICSAITDILVTFADDSNIVNAAVPCCWQRPWVPISWERPMQRVWGWKSGVFALPSSCSPACFLPASRLFPALSPLWGWLCPT